MARGAVAGAWSLPRTFLPGLAADSGNERNVIKGGVSRSGDTPSESGTLGPLGKHRPLDGFAVLVQEETTW